ncbi:hypothetical protein [Alkalihalobacterium bogoriense]|uniref:hypothetical protein n=1 Tax=Alkalihalobacterium bogoriense TaxID=246272 RepID=UPI00047AF6B0|nr:hypothetical protein [Alkalihalobacterium bogoriense]
MLIEKIDAELLNEIQEELDSEYNDIASSWDEEFVDLKDHDFEDVLRTEIFEHYHHIPFYKLEHIIDELCPFLKEKDIEIEPYSKITFFDNGQNKEVNIYIYADTCPEDREKLDEIELRQLEKLHEEITQLYNHILDVETALYISHVAFENVPKDYYHESKDENDCEFVQLEFN